MLTALAVTACGDEKPAAGTPPLAAPPAANIGYKSAVFALAEPAAVADRATVVAVEKQAVLNASLITYDTASSTFAQVNGDINANDDVVVKIEAHLVMDGYPDDGKAKNATLRMRGHSTRESEQKSYRVQLAKDAPAWNGERALQLNKHPYDLTHMRNKLAFDLFRDIPHIPSLRTQFVHLTISNKDPRGVPYDAKDYGLYTHVEKLGKDYLAARGLPRSGNIYKAENFEFKLSENLALTADGDAVNETNFKKTLSLEANNHNHTRLKEMLTALNDPGTDFEVFFAKYFDKSNYLTWLATSILFGNRDTINQNFALYQAANSDTFYFLPWDYDGAFGFEDQPDQAPAPLYASWQQTLANWWSIPLHQKFMKNPAHLGELKLAVDELYNHFLTEAMIKSRLDKYKPLVQPYIINPPDATYLPVLGDELQAEWEAECNRIPATVQKNRQLFLDGLENPMPFYEIAEPAEDGQLRLGWDESYDLQGDALSYQVQVAATPDFASPLVNQTVSNKTELMIPKPANGTYYLKVTARDSKGHSQISFTKASADEKTWFGVFKFEIY